MEESVVDKFNTIITNKTNQLDKDSDVIHDKFAETFYKFTNQIITKLAADFECDAEIINSYENIMQDNFAFQLPTTNPSQPVAPPRPGSARVWNPPPLSSLPPGTTNGGRSKKMKQKGGVVPEDLLLTLIPHTHTQDLVNNIPSTHNTSFHGNKKQIRAIMIGIHVGMVLMFVGAFCFKPIDGVSNDELFQASNNVDKLQTMLNKAILRCSSPLAMFTATKGQQLFCQALLYWNQAVGQLAPETMLFSFISGGVLLAGFSQIIQKLQPPAKLSYKVYTFFVMIVAYIILYVSLGLWVIGQKAYGMVDSAARTTNELTARAYKAAFNKVVGKIGQESYGSRKELPELNDIVDQTPNVFVKEKNQFKTETETETEEAFDNAQLSNLAKYGQGVVLGLVNEMKENAEMNAAAEILIALSESQGGKKKNKATPPKKPVKPKAPKSTASTKSRRAPANRA